MDSQIYGVLLFISLAANISGALPVNPQSKAINSNSVLVALLDSHYTELAELVEKALLLQTLEKAVSEHNITILAPGNEALERNLDPEFKRFLLQPGNLKSLQTLLLFHIIPTRIEARHWPDHSSAHHASLCRDAEKISLSHNNGAKTAGAARVIKSDDIIRPDGVIHGIERLLIPKSVQQDFNARRSLISTSAVIPQGAPEVDPRKTPRPKKVGSPPAIPIYHAMAPGSSMAPAPAPGPGGSRRHFDGESQVKDFIETLMQYGGYNELADILVNLTSLATEMGKLVSEGYVLTVLAPNDDAMSKLTAEQLSESGAAEQMIYLHIIPEYQTEESMYNSVRRFGKVNYNTLNVKHMMVVEESDGSVKVGLGGDSYGHLVDPDIYIDGRISVQGIDSVLFPALETTKATPKAAPLKIVSKQRRGKLLEMACTVLGAVGQDSHFSSCH